MQACAHQPGSSQQHGYEMLWIFVQVSCAWLDLKSRRSDGILASSLESALLLNLLMLRFVD